MWCRAQHGSTDRGRLAPIALIAAIGRRLACPWPWLGRRLSPRRLPPSPAAPSLAAVACRRRFSLRWPFAYDVMRFGRATSSNSPFLAPSIKHSHSFLSKTRTRPASSPATRTSTQSPLAHRLLSGKATSIEPSPSPDRSQASAARSMPSSSGVGLMTSSLVRAFSRPRSRASGSRHCRPSARPRPPTGRCM
jgi:hypothetical protein